MKPKLRREGLFVRYQVPSSKAKFLAIAFAALTTIVAASSAAQADTLVVDFTVSGPGWFGSGTSPFGLPSQPTINGIVTIDSTKTDQSAFLAIDWVTGSQTWQLSDIYGGGVTYSAPNVLSDFNFEASNPSGSTYVYSNNTVGITGGGFIACNSCVQITSVTDNSAVPGPIAGAGLPGLVFAGGAFLTWWRRKRTASCALAAA